MVGQIICFKLLIASCGKYFYLEQNLKRWLCYIMDCGCQSLALIQSERD